MTTAPLQTELMSLDDIYALAEKVLTSAGCDADNAAAIASTVARAERDGSASHGLFRIPGYVGSLRSGKVSGGASPVISSEMSCIIEVDAKMGYAPLALERGLPALAKAASTHGVAVMKVINSFHFAALWPETEYLAEQGLVGLACTAYKPAVAPAEQPSRFLAPTLFRLRGRVRVMRPLYMIWQPQPLQKVMFRLPHAMAMMCRWEQGLAQMVSQQQTRQKFSKV